MLAPLLRAGFVSALVLAVSSALCAQPELTRPASPSPVASDSPYIGFYSATRLVGDITQTLVLRLRADGRASLRTTTPPTPQQAAGANGAAAGAAPIAATQTFETGTWGPVVADAVVRFDRTSNIVALVPTDVKQESVEFSFSLSACALKLDADPNRIFGAAGLIMTKGSCP
jgi:hypothetical protein